MDIIKKHTEADMGELFAMVLCPRCDLPCPVDSEIAPYCDRKCFNDHIDDVLMFNKIDEEFANKIRVEERMRTRIYKPER